MIDQGQIALLVQEVMRKLENTPSPQGYGYGVFEEMEDAIQAAVIAHKELSNYGIVQRNRVIQAIRDTAVANAEHLARMAVEETGMGRFEDKITKNILAATKTPGTEDLETRAWSGDEGVTTVDMLPFGVIGAITPVTNPSETIINNGIGMIAAGNSVVFSPHPSAKRTSLETVKLLNKAAMEVGGPENLLVTVAEPTLAKAEYMMKHKKIDLLVATGGPAVVKAVLSSGKKAIGAGAGNPPAVVDETADIPKAAKDIIAGCSFDNNLPCIAEKEVIVVESVAKELIQCMQKSGGYLIQGDDVKRLEELLVQGKTVNKDYIGKDAQYILQGIGIEVTPEVKAVIMLTDKTHPFVVKELMMPVLPVIKVRNVWEAIDMGVEVEHGFRHTAVMHSKNIDHLRAFAKAIKTTIFVKNAPSYAGIGAGGEGHATFTIAGPTGEGLTSARDFARQRRCVLAGGLTIP